MASATSAWLSPPTRTEVIENLVSGVDRYNPSNVSILEDYLYHQIRSQEYDCLANLAILKLYQFNPDLYNADVVVNILLKSLSVSPHPDFHLALALLDDRPPNANAEEPDPLPTLLPQLTQLETFLKQCRFPAFWEYYRSDELEALRENYTVEFVGFEDAIREVVLRAVKAAFKRISSARLSLYLDLEGADYEAFLSKLGWQHDATTGVVTIPVNPDNQISSTVVQEDIKLPQLTKIIAHAATAH
ncbi:ARM repeat-containing protein [Punctularia strigosozonata HHB-11173 SS5]|uniref:ARM repeat-containing protein n=1 Tax=Punctularia strigosozonata (strain HHB-11173) TaxID=741275 RepID=UPI0004417C9A|nr:ARM repeat-containing protein [Punctularia strigosozonata HHB-11173 SS5]EIN13514.1 ARM repeat-containing protein [Punctularia strigosozonata HHB-11173 SS5]